MFISNLIKLGANSKNVLKFSEILKSSTVLNNNSVVGSKKFYGTEHHNIVSHDTVQDPEKERQRYNPALEEPSMEDSIIPDKTGEGVFENSAFVHHDSLHFFNDDETGLRAIVGIHDTLLGPALGGCRVYNYNNEVDAIFDVLRLSRGMTFKAACAGIPLGGGKAVIMGPLPDHPDGRSAVMRRFGMFLESLGGKYITAEDVGVQLSDMVQVKAMTNSVAGIPTEMGGSGNPAPYTAHGVYIGMKEAVQHRLEKNSLKGLNVLVEGAGAVGSRLIEKLVEDNANVYVCDVNKDSIDRVVKRFGVKVWEDMEHRFEGDFDVYSPCALGGSLDTNSIKKLKARVVAGAANNQLLSPTEHSQALHEAGICYTPDYICNAGGLVNVSLELRPEGWNHEYSMDYLSDSISTNLRLVFNDSKNLNITTHQAAKNLAIRRLSKAAYDQGSHKSNW